MTTRVTVLTEPRHQPHYRQIERALQRIEATALAAVPSDAELCLEFGVSRMTAGTRCSSWRRMAWSGANRAAATSSPNRHSIGGPTG